MKKTISFKDFIKKGALEKTPDGYVKIMEPLHYKMGKKDLYDRDDEGHVIIKEPIHFKHGMKKDNLKEEMSAPEKTHLDADHKNIPKNLPDEYLEHAHDKDLQNGLSSRLNQRLHDHKKPKGLHKEHLQYYTGHDSRDDNEPNSRRLNRSLAHGTKMHDHDEDVHHTIMTHAHPAGEDVHLYSGSRHDFSKMAKASKDHILHSPAHISASSSHRSAADYIRYDNHSGKLRDTFHINHIHVKPHHKILHISRFSDFPEEHESIIPAGTKLKYSHTTHHHDGLSKDVRVHHFTIHSQE